MIGPVFIPWFIVPKMDWLFWGWLKAFIGFSFYQVIASAFIFVFAEVLTSMFQVIGNISIANALTVLPALLITLLVCIYGLVKIPELTSAILSGRAGTWVDPTGSDTMTKTSILYHRRRTQVSRALCRTRCDQHLSQGRAAGALHGHARLPRAPLSSRDRCLAAKAARHRCLRHRARAGDEL